MIKKFIYTGSMLLLSVVAILTGLKQITQGIGQFSNVRSEYTQCIDAAAQAVNNATKLDGPNQELYMTILDSLDSNGLESRSEGKNRILEVQANFATIEAFYRLASKKLEEAQKHQSEENLIRYLKTQSDIYLLHAEARKLNFDFLALVLDESVFDLRQKVGKQNSIAKEIKEIREKAERMQSDNLEFAKQIPRLQK